MNKSQARRRSVQGGNSKSNLSMSTSRTSMNNRRQSRVAGSGLEKSEKSTTKIQVVGDDGKDVTPKPLFTGVPHDRASQIQLEENSSSENFRSIASIFQTGLGTQAGMSLFGQSILGSSRNSMRSQVMSSQMSGMSVASDLSDKPSTQSVNQHEIQKIAKTKQNNQVVLTPQDLEQEITITLDETETQTTFRLFGQIAQEETENIEKIKEENDEYLELCANREGNDKYVEHGMQTFNNKQKDKQTNTIPVHRAHIANQASTSLLWDAYNKAGGDSNLLEAQSSEEIALGNLNQSSSFTDKSGTSTLGKSSQSSSRLVKRTDDTNQNEIELRHNEILKSAELQHAMVLIERIISQNNYQRKIALYRGMNQLDQNGNVMPPDDDNEMKLNKLWAFQSPVTKNLTVTDITWNKVNPDIIAVAYGQIKGKKPNQKDTGGLICCWNLKNLEHPERVYHTNSSALSVSFSQMSPNLLAVGLYNGVVLIYNVARSEDLIAIDSYDTAGKHFGPAWKLEWVERERGSEERGEVLVSVSHDGRVIQWTIRKGFESLDLMKIKRTLSAKSGKTAAKSEHARISAFAPTLSFDFHPSDGNTYLVGTEEGTIHRCSCSYNEQTLDVYKGHGGPVYCVKWHPTLDNVFASCSEDWTIRIWTHKETKHVIKLDNGTKPIRHIQWSKYSENLLLSITESAIDIWDLTASILDPIMSMPFHPGVELNIIGIAPNSNCLFAGDSEGTINVYQIKGFTTKKAEAVQELIEATLNSHD